MINFNSTQSKILNIIQKILYRNFPLYFFYLNFGDYFNKNFFINKAIYILLNYRKKKFFYYYFNYNINKNIFIYRLINILSFNTFLEKVKTSFSYKAIFVLYPNFKRRYI